MSQENLIVSPDPSLTIKLIDLCLKGLPVLIESWWTQDQDDISNLAKALTGRSREVLSILAKTNEPQTVTEIRREVMPGLKASESNLEIIDSEFSYRLLWLAGLGVITRHPDGQHVKYAISDRGKKVQALFK